MSERIYVKVFQAGRKRPSLEFQAESADEAIREFCLWLRRAHPEVFRAVISGADKKMGELRGWAPSPAL